MTDYPTPWTKYDRRSPHVYGNEAKCWQSALFDESDQTFVGVVARGYPRYSGLSDPFKPYGLMLKVRQAKAYVEPKRREPQHKEMHDVRTEFYDRHDQLAELKTEHRMVYWNSTGPYIKTRGKGNVRITDPTTMTIIYRELLVPTGLTPNEDYVWRIRLEPPRDTD